LEPKIGIPEKDLHAEVETLNGLLADLFLLYTKTRNAHWNIVGPHFRDLHKMFEEQYEMLDDEVDDVAERVRALGGFAHASLGDYHQLAHLKDSVATAPFGPKPILTELLNDHETVIRELRDAADRSQDKHRDIGTADFLTGLVEAHEKTAWMLRATLEQV